MKHIIPFCFSFCLFLSQGVLTPTFGAVDENGRDTGNLSLTTQSLSYEDIRDKTRSDNLSASAGTSGFQGAGIGFSDKAGLNHATIGQGTITVGNQTNPDLDGLNRDVANATVDIKDTGVQLNLDKASLDVILNPIQTAEGIANDTKQIGLLTKTAVKMVDASLENDASLKEGADAVAMGFNAVNNPAANARNKTDLAEKIANTENMTPEQLQEVTTLLFQEMQKQNLILDPATMKLVSTDGLTNEQIKQYHAATNEKNLQSFLNIQKTDVTNGGSIYESLSAETIRQIYARAAKADPEATRNNALEKAVEHVAAGASKDTWNTFSNEQPTPKNDWNMLADVQLNKPVTHEDWIAKNKNSDVITAGNAELNKSNPNDVKPFFTPDTILDLGFLVYDVVVLVHDEIKTGGENRKENVTALTADGLGFLAPGFAGAGLMVRAGKGLDKAVDGLKAADKVSDGVKTLDKANDINKTAKKGAETTVEASKGTNKAPDFVVSPGGTAYPVPKDAQGPKPVINPQGKQTGSAFTGGEGGANKQVDTIRIMDPTLPSGKSPGYPEGYIKYENKGGQGVDPYSGRTIPNTQSHYPID